MSYSHQKNNSKNRSLFEDSEQSYQFQSHYASKANEPVGDKFSSLYEARQRFIKFVSQLEYHKSTQIREDIMSHCEQNKKRQNLYDAYMSDDIILKTINLRIEKMIKNKRIKKNWSEEDVQILIWVVSKYSDKKQYDDIQKQLDIDDWQMIASLIPGVTAESCMFKWLSLKKVNLATNNWSQEQSTLLRDLVRQNDPQTKSKDSKNWKHISQRLYFLNQRQDKIFRNAKQCRQHWNCYLNPNLKKGPWRPEQDMQLLKCIKQNKGSKKWSQIVRYFDGRTQNALKNRYTLIIEKQKKYNKHKSQLDLIEQYLVKCYMDQFTTEIKGDSSDQQEKQSDLSFGVQKIKEEKKQFETPVKREEDPTLKIWDTPITPVTPVKVQKIDFKNVMQSFCGRLSFIQPGILKDGIFSKSSFQLENNHENNRQSSFKVKRIHSSFM